VDSGSWLEIIKALKKDVEDFIIEPIQKDTLEKTLDRAFEKLELKRKLKELQQVQNGQSDSVRVKDLVKTEKLISVRQVVDKLSSFVAYIARDVQGGMRYFKEMPYFVSIHDANCNVIATNSIYKKHFGNKIGKDSCEIYVGDSAEKKCCPVAKTIDTGNVQENHGVVQYLSGRKVPVIVHTAPFLIMRAKWN
jgi:benzoyl-CoA reductase/2-hydroxyglutaryl-CoA dehydratase subunit BcrC/BadD/HgdB